jgi:phosphoglycolate phosphatase-like HAD superfamily hydrolase
MKKTILWDFDGVILDSMEVRDFGFREIFKKFKKEHVSQLIDYHRINGGLSRYVKIRYFFEDIMHESIEADEVMKYAINFSEIMRKELTNPKNLISESVSFIRNNFDKYCFHIVSGSDQEELRFLCKELSIANYFISIHGSPTPKTRLVKELLEKYDYKLAKTCLIGDSINDFEAASLNNISFYGYNNESLIKLKSNHISSFKTFVF